MITEKQQRAAAKKFVEEWTGKGYEKGESQKFWIQLLREVLGVANPEHHISFEDKVKLDHTSFIDGYIPSTKVLIEQKSIDKDLRAPIRQSDGNFCTPFQQAKRYSAELPYSKRPRWVVTCNFKSFFVYDMEQPHNEPAEILLKDLEKEYYRLSFLADTEDEHLKKEMEVSFKAGEIVGLLYDALLEEYHDKTNPETLKSINILCVRLVFCLYAEDAGIFGKHDMFLDYLRKFDAGRMRKALIELFDVLDTKIDDRDPYMEDDLKAFPYVNGGLFAKRYVEIPQFTDKIRTLLLEKASAGFDWSEISPTIFGAVFESTLNPDTRRKGGMHYTSIENIHKVIDPLFMDDLRDEFDTITSEKVEKQRQRKLESFQNKLASLTFLDPACGSGNFLTETYVSLRKLENKILVELNKGQITMGAIENPIKVSIHQFYGIEINDFAVTVAKTALWIAESQMIAETEKIVQHDIDFLPLKSYANIVEGNALHINWNTLRADSQIDVIYTEKLNIYQTDDLENSMTASEPALTYGKKQSELNVVTKSVEFKDINKLKDNTETQSVTYDYIMGNPPFVGYGLQSEQQKEDTLKIYLDNDGKSYKTAGKIDYVANWYFKAAKLIQNTKTRCAFVSTNSIVQGEQVASVWRPIFEQFNIHIDFAYQTFKWSNETTDRKNMAAVHCVIIGFSHENSEKEKKIYKDNSKFITAENISPYLIDSQNVWIESRPKPLCNVPFMTTGNRPADGGHLIIEGDEYEDFIKKEPAAIKYIKKLTGAEEFINNKKRYCLWLVGASPAEIRNMPEIYKRVQLCRDDRLNGAADRQKLADTPTLFRELKNPESYIIVPATSSENRKYIPIGFLDSETIPTNSAVIIPDATLYHFGILTSSVHMAWMRTVAGRLKSDYRYSKDIVYNNFPWPNPTDEQKAKIEHTAQAILDARAKYPDSSLADLYDEFTMPHELRKAHQDNDRAVMAAYSFDQKLLKNDEEQQLVAELFRLYQQLTGK